MKKLSVYAPNLLPKHRVVYFIFKDRNVIGKSDTFILSPVIPAPFKVCTVYGGQSLLFI